MRARLAILSLLMLSVSAAQANASTVTRTQAGPNFQLAVNEAGFVTAIFVERTANSGAEYLFTNDGGYSVIAGQGCTDNADHSVATCPAPNTQLSLSLGNQGDRVTIKPGFDLPVSWTANGGDDKLVVPADVTFTADGGDGNDTVVFTGDTGVTANLDGQSGDGKGTIATSVENITGGNGADALTGDDRANRIDGGGGDDHIDAGNSPDTIFGGDGNDTIEARDSADDTIDCGGGVDSVRADSNDSLVGCENVDRPDDDQDGSPDAVDCNDRDPALHPGATDVAGNGVDENCDGHDEALPPPKRITSGIANRWRAFAKYTVALKLVVTNPPVGATATVRCKGRGCPKRKTLSAEATGQLELRFTGFLARRKLRPGATVEVSVTAPGYIGKRVTYKVRRGKEPRVSATCLAVDTGQPQACPAG